MLEEQQRQRLYNREDDEKLRMVSIHNTSWARDLALASGSSDADAVKSNFDEARKSREFYLLKMARTSPSVATSRTVPEFMRPATHQVKLSILDAHTASQIRYRQQARQDSRGESQQDSKQQEVTVEPVRDVHNESLSRRAAGFSADGEEKVNMAAVLSGMGAVTEPSTVSA